LIQLIPFTKLNDIPNWIKITLGIKIVAAILYCFVGFSHPHIIRQNVTISVSQSYAILWKTSDNRNSNIQDKKPWLENLLPHSLAAGDRTGLLEMEFPFVNILTAPALLIKDITTARILARLILVLLVLIVFFGTLKVWDNQYILGIPVKMSLSIFPLLSLTQPYLQRFMPDFISVLFCLLAIGSFYRNPRSVFGRICAGLFLTLGLLIKPTSIVTLFILPLMEPLFSLKFIRRHWLWLSSAILITGIYYVYGLKWIREHSDLPPYVKTEFRNPIHSLGEFLSHPKALFNLVNDGLLFPGMIYFLMAYFLYRCFHFLKNPKKKNTETNFGAFVSNNQMKLILIIFLQIISIAFLDGSHAFIHNYYFLGLGFTLSLLLTSYLLQFRGVQSAFTIATIGILIFSNLENQFYELRDLFIHRSDSTHSFWQNCATLKKRHPELPWNQGFRFRSPEHPTSEWGVCFGEIQGSTTSQYGFSTVHEPLLGCEAIASEADLILYRCPN
jgi:hypothetical protein